MIYLANFNVLRQSGPPIFECTLQCANGSLLDKNQYIVMCIGWKLYILKYFFYE